MENISLPIPPRYCVTVLLAFSLLAMGGSSLLAQDKVVQEKEGKSFSAEPILPAFAEPIYFDVALRPRARVSPLGEKIVADLRPMSAVEVARYEVSVKTTGNVTIDGESEWTFSLQDSGGPEPTITFTVSGPGEGEVRTVIQGISPAGDKVAEASDVVYFNASGGEVLYGRSSPLVLRMRRLVRDRESGDLTPEEYEKQARETMDGTPGAASTSSVMQGKAKGANITIKGEVKWTDRDGNTHPSRQATVQIWEDDGPLAGGDDLVTTVSTNDNGEYSATIDNNDGIGQNGRDPYVRVLTKGPGFTVRLPSDAGGMTRRMVSKAPIEQDVSDGSTVTSDFKADNSGNNNSRQRAFSVHDALITIVRYVSNVNGSSLSDIDVVYPWGGSISKYDGTNLLIEEPDWPDWDTIHHEYGHYIQDELNISNSPGGGHSSTDNLSQERQGNNIPNDKDGGTRLAWGEAWPTYNTVVAQNEQNASALNVQRVGNLDYDAWEQGLHYSLESKGPGSKGEDNERSIMRSLFDLYDSSNDTRDETALGDQEIWNKFKAMSGNKPVRLSEAYRKIISDKSIEEKVEIGEIMAHQEVAPDPHPDPSSGKHPPKDGKTLFVDCTDPATGNQQVFKWDTNGGGDEFRSDEHTVKFYNRDFSKLLFTKDISVTKTDDEADYTPTPDECKDKIFGRSDTKKVKWFVEGTQSDNPETGPYIGPAETIQPKGADIATVIDRSGSMRGSKMSSAKSAASAFVGLLNEGDGTSVSSFSTSAGVNFSFDRITRKNTVRTDAQNAINRLSAGGGTNITAGIVSGLNQLDEGWKRAPAQAMILLGDGKHNSGPSPSTLFPIRKNVEIHTIALGSGADTGQMLNIANATGGTFSFAPGGAQLLSIYNNIQTSLKKGRQKVASKSGNIKSGGTETLTASVDKSVTNAFFQLGWEGSDLDLTLTNPNGQKVTPSTASSDPKVRFSEVGNTESYVIRNPESGEWTQNIQAVDVPSGGENFTASVSGDATLAMEVSFGQASHLQDEDITIQAEIKDDNTPVPGATVTADVTTPTKRSAQAKRGAASSAQAEASGEANETLGQQEGGLLQFSEEKEAYVDRSGNVYYQKSTLTLHDDGAHGDGAADDGVYANTFSNTSNEGSYTFDVSASGTAPNSGNFQREGSKSTVVSVPLQIAGKVIYPQIGGGGDELQGATITATPQIGASGRSAQSGSDGSFDLDVADQTTYDVSVTDVSGDAKGVNILDALAIQRFLLGRVNFSNFQQTVADVDDDTNASIVDALEIEKMLLGRISSFPAGKFRSETVTVNISGSNQSLSSPLRVAAAGDADFSATGFGGSSSSAALATLRTGAGAPVRTKAEPGSTFAVPIRVERGANLGAYQFAFDYSTEKASFKGARGPGNEVQAHDHDGTVKLTWFDSDGGKSPVSVAEGEAIVTLTFEAAESIEGGDSFRLENVEGTLGGPEAEPLSGVGVTIPVVRFGSVRPESFALKENAPNPFRQRTAIRLDMPESGRATVEVYNVLGQQVATVQKQLSAGSRRIEIEGSGLGSGTYFYRVRVELGSETIRESGRMTVIR